MKRSQWFIISVGSMIFSIFMFSMTSGWVNCFNILDGDAMIACNIIRYSYAIPAIIGHFISLICFICGWFEK